ncbi:MAG: hypothetical protein C9356_15735 [Oleiphilus sp.]|nr:MAG: hypothetical protein C9356_15735 [Oleiphilus sp.]
MRLISICIALLISLATHAMSQDDDIRAIVAETERLLGEGSPLTKQDRAITDMALDYESTASIARPGFDPAKLIDQTQQAFGIDIPGALGKTRDEVINHRPKGKSDNVIDAMDEGIVIFVSQSMGRSLLEQSIVQAIKHDAVIVFRGVNQDQPIDDILNLMGGIVRDNGWDDIPKVLLDPLSFRRLDVQKVPAVLVKGADGQQATFLGRLNLAWIKQQVSLYGYKDFGLSGEIVDISEVDMIDEIQRRLANVDYDELRKDATKNYFEKKHRFIHLPTAQENRSYYLDPSFRTTKDQLLPTGQYWYKANETHNPLSNVTLRKQYIVIDPLNKAHLEKLRDLLRTGEIGGKERTLLLTRIPSENFTPLIFELRKEFLAEAYLYTQIVHNKFGIEHIPAMVEQAGDQLLIREYGIF